MKTNFWLIAYQWSNDHGPWETRNEVTEIDPTKWLLKRLEEESETRQRFVLLWAQPLATEKLAMSLHEHLG